MYLIFVLIMFLLYFIYVITRQTMVTVGMLPLSITLLISLFGWGKNIDYMPAFYFYGVLLILTRHCVHPITLLASVGYPHTSKYFIIYTHTVKYIWLIL